MPLTYSTAVLCAVFIITGAVSGEDVKKAVGETVSFRPAKLGSPVTSFTWKQINGGVVKAIEWDVDDGFSTPNQRFQNITTLDKETGQITITKLTVKHSGIYSIDINSKEQQHRFSLTVMERVTKPEITTEKGSNPDVAYLRCNYSETVIWKNSAGDTLEGTKNHNPGEFITVNNTKTPGNFYTCTLKNAVSEETSDPVYERDLFVIERVPKPKITIEKGSNPDVVYLRCGYSETIIWKNSAGDTLKGTKNHNPGEFITVTKTRTPEHFYTCTLKNAVSEETSDPVYEREMFIDSGPWWIALIVLVIPILLAASFILPYKFSGSFHNLVSKNLKDKPCIGALLNCLDGKKKDPPKSSSDAENGGNTEIVPLKSSSDAENGEVIRGNAETDPPKSPSDAENGEGIREKTETVPLKSSSDAENGGNTETVPLKSSSDAENGGNTETDPLKSSSDAEKGEGSREKAETADADKQEGAENSDDPLKADRDGDDKEVHL